MMSIVLITNQAGGPLSTQTPPYHGFLCQRREWASSRSRVCRGAAAVGGARALDSGTKCRQCRCAPQGSHRAKDRCHGIMVIASADASVRPTSNHYETCMWYRERSVPWVQNSMRDGLFAAVAAAALLIVAHNASAQINETTRAEIARMRWQPATNLHLPTSHSVIGELPRFSGLTGAEAIRLRDIVDANGSQAVEADIIDWDTSSEIIFSYNPTGYIRIDDWSDVDPDAMLKAIQANDESANAQRRAKGLAALHTRRWLERPTLHADTNTVSWIIEGGDDQNDRTINAVALKLGRYGFERIVWVTDPQNFNVGSNDLAAAIANHQFDHSYRYADYQPDKDRAAEYGVAGTRGRGSWGESCQGCGRGRCYCRLKEIWRAACFAARVCLAKNQSAAGILPPAIRRSRRIEFRSLVFWRPNKARKSTGKSEADRDTVGRGLHDVVPTRFKSLK